MQPARRNQPTNQPINQFVIKRSWSQLTKKDTLGRKCAFLDVAEKKSGIQKSEYKGKVHITIIIPPSTSIYKRAWDPLASGLPVTFGDLCEKHLTARARLKPSTASLRTSCMLIFSPEKLGCLQRISHGRPKKSSSSLLTDRRPIVGITTPCAWTHYVNRARLHSSIVKLSESKANLRSWAEWNPTISPEFCSACSLHCPAIAGYRGQVVDSCTLIYTGELRAAIFSTLPLSGYQRYSQKCIHFLLGLLYLFAVVQVSGIGLPI